MQHRSNGQTYALWLLGLEWLVRSYSEIEETKLLADLWEAVTAECGKRRLGAIGKAI